MATFAIILDGNGRIKSVEPPKGKKLSEKKLGETTAARLAINMARRVTVPINVFVTDTMMICKVYCRPI